MARLENRATGVVSCCFLLSRLFPLLAFWGGDMNYKIIRPRFLEVLVCCITPFKGSPEGMENSLCPWKTKGVWREAAGVGFRPSQLSIQLLRGLYPRVLLAGPKAQRRSCYDLTVKYTPTTPAHVCALDHLVPRWDAVSEVLETWRKEVWLTEMCLLGWVFENCYSTLLPGLSFRFLIATII